MKHMILAGMIIGALVFSTAVNAQPNRNINRHQYNQQARIKHGVRDGSLTKHEVKQLRRQQAKVKHYKQMAMADGRMSRGERRLIYQTQRRANHNIYHKKHNNNYRY